MSDPTVLVTGANGFLGRALTDRLLADGVAVRAGLRTAPADFPAAADVRLIPPDSNELQWRRLVAGVDAIAHCAARVHVLRETESDPLAAFRRVNVDLTMNLANAAAASGVRRFVFISSIGVLGAETFGTPFRSDTPHKPHSSYAQSKLEAETALRNLAARTGVELVIVRPPLVCGPGASGNFPRLLGLVARGIPMPFGSLENRRSLVGLDNLVDFVKTCLFHPAAPAHVQLPTDGKPISTPQLIRAIAMALGRPDRVIPFPPSLLRRGLELAGRGSLAQQLCGSLEIDGSQSAATLSWTPPGSIEAQLQKLAAAYVQNRSG